MAILSVKTRQTYMKALGFYTGSVDGVEGPKTKAAYLALQKKYFERDKDIDGLYGKNTDILLRSAYNMKDAKNFKLSEFRCKCGGKYCTGFPAEIDKDLIDNLQKLRDTYRQSIKIQSGLRCTTWNSLQGGAAGSRHKSGKAADIYMSGITTSVSGRKKIIKAWYSLPNSRYSYANINGAYPNMGSSVHVDVR